ncbi:MAG: cytochrome c biogenesis CcdA family protein [Spirochaetia bacterium]|jgi:cytochrome c-type biogenesis protein|nr:cytochrome c biogenesis CcdA family protein [Spirochaetia bacterium]
MGVELSAFAAFAAGLFSFLSPCVLPLIPSFLSVLGGLVPESGDAPDAAREETRRPPARRFFVAAAGFVAGFSCVFVVLGILFAGAGFLLGGVNRVINMAAGILIVILGLNILFGFLPFLNYEKRFHAARRPRGAVGAFLVGTAFGAGWSPCIGPILGSILLLAGGSAQPGRAALYLALYSAGLGLPFLAAALFFDNFKARFAALKTLVPAARTFSGLFLVLMGVLVFLGRLAFMNAFFLKNGYALAAWAGRESFLSRFIPAAVFFLAAVLPPAWRRFRGKQLSLCAGLCCGIFLLLAAAQALGLINCAALVSKWLLYQGL